MVLADMLKDDKIQWVNSKWSECLLFIIPVIFKHIKRRSQTGLCHANIIMMLTPASNLFVVGGSGASGQESAEFMYLTLL